MTKNELLKLMGSWDNLFLLNRSTPEPGEYLPLLMEIALEGNATANWRASWAADKLVEKHPAAALPWREPIIAALPDITHTGKRRQLLRIITRCEIPESVAGNLFDYCQERLFTPDESIAVKAYAMQILYNISGQEHGLKQEVLQTMEQVIETNSGKGILACARKFATRLRKEIPGT